MYARIFVTGVIAALTVSAQSFPRRATMVNGGGRDFGQCTVEVSVDGAAQIEIRGDDANLRNTKGQPPQWRRFECTAPMPPNAVNLQLQPLSGRGPQALVRDPRNNGGTAVVNVEDPEDGPDIYAFNLFWGDRREGGPPPSGVQDRRGPDFRDGDRRDDRAFEGPGLPDRRDRRFTTDQALQVCQNSIRDQATDRFRTRNIEFRNVAMDDNPGARDRVVGQLAVRRSMGRRSYYKFSCSVNFDTGLVRTAHIDQFESSYYPQR
jgi:hypothetical protein